MGLMDELDELEYQAREVNSILKGIFRDIGLTLVDFNLEFGRLKLNGKNGVQMVSFFSEMLLIRETIDTPNPITDS